MGKRIKRPFEPAIYTGRAIAEGDTLGKTRVLHALLERVALEKLEGSNS